MNFDAVILAGGDSRRMGRDKAWLPVAGLTLLARQIKLARELGPGEVYISGRADGDYSSLGCRVLLDEKRGIGPLAGVLRALQTTPAPLLLVLAVDMPAMRSKFLEELAGHCATGLGAVPRLHGRIEPLAVFYPKSATALLENFLNEGHRAARRFAAQCIEAGLLNAVEVPGENAACFVNWNSPADLAAK